MSEQYGRGGQKKNIQVLIGATPWRHDGEEVQPRIFDDQGIWLATVNGTDFADVIVRAVNAHGDLLAACEEQADKMDDAYALGGDCDFDLDTRKLRALIAKAKGQT